MIANMSSKSDSTENTMTMPHKMMQKMNKLETKVNSDNNVDKTTSTVSVKLNPKNGRV